jgi:hypothetical protein
MGRRDRLEAKVEKRRKGVVAPGVYPSIRLICTCGHYDASHEELTGRCHNHDGGQACECLAFAEAGGKTEEA